MMVGLLVVACTYFVHVVSKQSFVLFVPSLHSWKPGFDAELYYIRDGFVNHCAISFNLSVSTETNSLLLTWNAREMVNYQLAFHVDRPLAMKPPTVNISSSGQVPRASSVFKVSMRCTGQVDGEVSVLMKLSLTIESRNRTILTFPRRKHCYRTLHAREIIAASSDVYANIASSSTRVFYISVGVCCAAIVLVALLLAALHVRGARSPDSSRSETLCVCILVKAMMLLNKLPNSPPFAASVNLLVFFWLLFLKRLHRSCRSFSFPLSSQPCFSVVQVLCCHALTFIAASKTLVFKEKQGHSYNNRAPP
uniref:WIF domain-containing protein n=1 Tax=Eptatretus burgeri TaxID=7764 RepID=A0A8C4WQV4_EPTBU